MNVLSQKWACWPSWRRIGQHWGNRIGGHNSVLTICNFLPEWISSTMLKVFHNLHQILYNRECDGILLFGSQTMMFWYGMIKCYLTGSSLAKFIFVARYYKYLTCRVILTALLYGMLFLCRWSIFTRLIGIIIAGQCLMIWCDFATSAMAFC